jgi:integrase
MRVRLKGLKVVTKRAADGRMVKYYYAWRGGPRIEGEPGTPAFIASYNAAVAKKPVGDPKKRLHHIFDAYQDSGEFAKLAPRTRLDYERLLKAGAAKFGTLPQAALPDRRTRAKFLEWRDELARKSERQADYAWTVLARALSWAVKRGLIDDNPCEKGGRLYTGTRADCVWTEADVAAMEAAASPQIRLALTLALWTGQRQGDLLALTWAAYDGQYIRLRQGKTGVRVVIPVGAPLRIALDATKRLSPSILLNSDGKPWTPDGFRVSWRKTCAKAKVTGVTFHDLRGTAVLNLSLAAATVQEIATITGHKLGDVQSILDSNYFHRDLALAESGIAKLEEHQKAKQQDRKED